MRYFILLITCNPTPHPNPPLHTRTHTLLLLHSSFFPPCHPVRTITSKTHVDVKQARTENLRLVSERNRSAVAPRLTAIACSIRKRSITPAALSPFVVSELRDVLPSRLREGGGAARRPNRHGPVSTTFYGTDPADGYFAAIIRSNVRREPRSHSPAAVS